MYFIMGYESASASIGIRIILSELVLQINEINFDLIKEMLNSGFVEDEDDYYNDSYINIIEECNKLGNYEVVKKYLIERFKELGAIDFGGVLFDRPFLLPIKVILENDRWGYERNCTNAISRPIDVDLSISTEKYKDIENFKIVFIPKQSGG